MRFVIVIGVLLGGCSFAFVNGPPPQHQQLPYFDCTSSRVAPVLDTIFTALQVLNVGLAVSDNDAEWEDRFGGDAPIARKPSIALYAGLAALGAAGAYYGFTKTGECRDAKLQLMMRAGQQQQPGTWPPPAAAPAPAPAPGPAPAPLPPSATPPPPP